MSRQNDKKYDLENRLIDFAAMIIQLAHKVPGSIVGKHVKSQIIRSGTSPAANYAEGRGAESRTDFIHKLKIALKELRETRVWLLIIQRVDLLPEQNQLEVTLKENDELISILFKSIDTAKSNLNRENRASIPNKK
jgi:four helix bundle protein